MSIFYCDKVIMDYENSCQWDRALIYLEEKYNDIEERRILYSLIGFSWLYYIEGPIMSKKYAFDPNDMALGIWKKYIDIGAHEAKEDPFFCFLTGYTLSLHGVYLSEKYEKMGNLLMMNCVNLAKDPLLKQMAETFLVNERSQKYVTAKNNKQICEQYFNGKSLLDQYFNAIYGG